MFTKANGINFVVTFTAVVAALVVHQIVISPMIVKKKG